MSVAIGLDVGTSGVKALAVAEDGEIVGRAEVGYGLSTPKPGLGRAGPRGLVARDAAGARGARRGRRRRDRPVGPDARPRRARRRRAGAAPGDPLERPAHRRPVRGDRGAHRAPGPDRGHRQPRADGLHRPEAAVAARARARRLRADRAHPAPQGLRPPAPVRRAGDRRRRRLRHAAVRRRAPALERGGLLGARDRHGLAAARARVARGLGRDERRHPGRRRRRRPGRRGARRRGRRGGRAAVGRARHLGRRVLRAARVRRRRGGARARVLPRRARDLARDGRDALGRGVAGVAARRGGRRCRSTAIW